ncbi:MAG: hypothetical protein JRJ29_21410, partial [Deltaproteobacteria bacterium]|nr:hypothetical protein [Deltaproteobacteria bacterium]
IKLYPLLKAMGVDDKTIEAALGKEIAELNRKDADPRALQRAMTVLFKNPSTADAGKKLLEYFSRGELAPELTEVTLGKKYERVTPQALLDAAANLVRINKGEGELFPRDAITAYEIHTPASQFRFRLASDAGGNARKALWRVTNKGSLSAIPSNVFSPVIYSTLFRSGLAQALEETNPVEIVDKLVRVVKTGEYGMRGSMSVPAESHFLHPSHFLFLDPARSPESERIGLDLRLARDVVIDDKNGILYVPVVNAKTGKTELLSNRQMKDVIVALPGQEKEKYPVAIVHGVKQTSVPASKVDYHALNPDSMFSHATSLVPLTSCVSQARLLVGSKFATQALPLEGREAPLVQTLLPDGKKTVEELLGEKAGAIRSPVYGTVLAATDKFVKIRGVDGKVRTFDLYNNYPMNRMTYYHQTPVVHVGQNVSAGDLLAVSNYTDDKGTLALGTNLRVAFIPSGKTFEDAAYISDAAAKKLTSIHMFPKSLDKDPDIKVGYSSYISIFPAVYNRQQLEKIDENGLIRPGSVVEKGDPLILAYRKRTKKPYYYQLRRGVGEYANASVEWDKSWPGVVTDARPTANGWQVFVKAATPAVEADKIGVRMGGKSVLASVVPSEQMPKTEDGKPIDLVISPLAILTRGNPAMLVEAYLGKIAALRGEPYRVRPFMEENMMQFALNELKKHGLKPEEPLIDSATGRRFSHPVATGVVYVYKLMHMAEEKAKGRTTGAYTAEGIPGRGGPDSAKRMGNQVFNALLSSGALNVIQDALLVRGQKNPAFWSAFKLGMLPPLPRIPYVHREFIDMLKASGVNVERRGNQLHIMPLTDQAIEEISRGPIKSSAMLDAKTLKPLPGGLFDPSKTGGPGAQDFWAHIDLPIRVPNPIMVPVIASLLEIPQKSVRMILAGQEKYGGKTGYQAIAEGLAKLNVDNQIKLI